MDTRKLPPLVAATREQKQTSADVLVPKPLPCSVLSPVQYHDYKVEWRFTLAPARP